MRFSSIVASIYLIFQSITKRVDFFYSTLQNEVDNFPLFSLLQWQLCSPFIVKFIETVHVSVVIDHSLSPTRSNSVADIQINKHHQGRNTHSFQRECQSSSQLIQLLVDDGIEIPFYHEIP